MCSKLRVSDICTEEINTNNMVVMKGKAPTGLKVVPLSCLLMKHNKIRDNYWIIINAKT